MIRGNPCPNQPERGRQPVDDINAYFVAELFLQCLGGVITGGAGTNDRDVQHPQLLAFQPMLAHPAIAARTWRQKPLPGGLGREAVRSEEHTSELQSLMRISYAF